jgi:hypothetical protein
MTVDTGGDLKIGDVVWHYDSGREPPQRKQRVRAIALLDREAHAERSVVTLAWSVVRTQPLDVRVELDPALTWAGGSQVFPCAEPIGQQARAVDGNTTGAVAAVACGVVAAVVIGFFVLFAYGVMAFVVAQALAGIAVALFTKAALPWMRSRGRPHAAPAR